VIHVDGHPAYPQAIRELKASGELSRRCRCRPSAYLNNVLEQDHRFLKRRMAASQWFRSVEGALRTIAGYEAMNMIRKGQIRWLAKGDTAGVRSVTSSRFSGLLLNTIFRSPSNSLVQTYLRQILLAALSRDEKAWNRRMNRNRVKISWKFDRNAARCKFGY